jgi:hypothetical protein
MKDLICDCCAADPRDRPLFDEIFDRLESLEVKPTADVNSPKQSAFVGKIKADEIETPTGSDAAE